MSVPARSFPLWFLAPFVPMVAAQVIRLQQTEPLYWLLCDYGGRLGTMLVLALIPLARQVAYRPHSRRTSWWETLLWIIGVVGFYLMICAPLSRWLNHTFPGFQLGHYPELEGGLYLFDLTFGVLLVAWNEEVVFRRCGEAAFQSLAAGPVVTVVGAALLFAAYHWTFGLGSVTANFLFGLVTMIWLRRSGALWPLITAHFLIDAILFAGLF